MSEHLDERLRTAARTYRRLGNQSAESMFLEAADTICKIQAENAKLRELAVGMYGMLETFDKMLGNHDACKTPRPLIFGEDKSFKDVMCELEIEVMQ